jgi:hypothetical protein
MHAEMQHLRVDAIRERKERKKMQAKLDVLGHAHVERKFITEQHNTFHGEHIQAISQLTTIVTKSVKLSTADAPPHATNSSALTTLRPISAPAASPWSTD